MPLILKPNNTDDVFASNDYKRILAQNFYKGRGYRSNGALSSTIRPGYMDFNTPFPHQPLTIFLWRDIGQISAPNNFYYEDTQLRLTNTSNSNFNFIWRMRTVPGTAAVQVFYPAIGGITGYPATGGALYPSKGLMNFRFEGNVAYHRWDNLIDGYRDGGSRTIANAGLIKQIVFDVTRLGPSQNEVTYTQLSIWSRSLSLTEISRAWTAGDGFDFITYNDCIAHFNFAQAEMVDCEDGLGGSTNRVGFKNLVPGSTNNMYISPLPAGTDQEKIDYVNANHLLQFRFRANWQ